jgi:prepilin-type N-terminal cleavage/methylation domain-containing protein
MRPHLPLLRATRRTSAGFTLVELVMVIVITGALAVFALPRMLDLTDWRLRAFADELRAQTLAMQRLALQQRRVIVGTITGTGVSYAYSGGAVIVSLSCPSGASPCIAEGGSRTVTFNAGNTGATSTSMGAALVITVASGSSTRVFRLENDSGLLRQTA